MAFGPQDGLPIEVVQPYTAVANRDRVLVVYNTNVPEAQALAEHYRTARSLDPAHMCGVKMPPGYYASGDEVLGARKTIVEQCICGLLDPAVRPSPCTVSNIAAIAAVSPISHLVFMKGMPIRLVFTGWTHQPGVCSYGDEMPSLGYFLGYLVYNNVSIFGDNTKCTLKPTYPGVGIANGAPPPLSPATVRWAAYGFIDAVTFARAHALIDRTLLAEDAGFLGNMTSEDPITGGLSQYFVKLTEGFGAECSDYLTHTPFVFGAPESSWPYDVCRYGTTGSPVSSAPSGNYPGELGTTIPYPVDVGMFLGTNPWPNGQRGFDGFDVMRSTTSTCGMRGSKRNR